MLKRFVLACVLATGAAYADGDTKPMLSAIHECPSPLALFPPRLRGGSRRKP